MSNKAPNFLAALIFLIVACLGFYRLMFGFPISVGGVHIGHTASFFTFVVFAALGAFFLKKGLARA